MARPKKDVADVRSVNFTAHFLPETKRRLDVIAVIDGLTLNEIINQWAENYCEQRAAEIAEYDAFVNNMRQKNKSASNADD